MGDELIKEFILQPPGAMPFNKGQPADLGLLPVAYSGPTIESSYANYGVHTFLLHEDKSEAERISMLRVSKGENNCKYTLRIKSCGRVMADDGYKWRKYGQKSIKNSPNPRSYYRCTNPRCNAKKQVERSTEDPEILVITYEGLHLHFTYPFFIFDDNNHQTHPPTKKQKGQPPEAQEKADEFTAQTENGSEMGFVNLDSGPQMSPDLECVGHEGLLEDIVPLMIRRPLVDSSSSNSSPLESDPSSNSMTWSPPPTYSHPGLFPN